MKDFYTDLDTIRKRPGMYIERNSISNLKFFLSGYKHAYANMGGIKTLEPLPFFLFTTFVAEKYNESASMGWCRIILNQVKQDEEKGLDLFFELIEEFKAIKVTECQMANLTQDNRKYHETISRHRQCLNYDLNVFIPAYINAERIFVIKLNDKYGYLFAIEYEDAVCMEEYCFDKKLLMKAVEKDFGDVQWEHCSKNLLYGKSIFNHGHIIDLSGKREYWGNI